MKVRKGFVSNSSSSSFVCDITGEDSSGWDMCLSGAGMVECVNGHVFFPTGMEEVEAWVDDASFDWSKDGYEDADGNVITEEEMLEECGGYKHNIENNYNLPARLCPICQKDPEVMEKIKKRLVNEAKRLGVDL